METIEVNEAGKQVRKTVSTEQQNSIEISQNAKGERAFKVKVYSDNPGDMSTVLDGILRLAESKIGD